MPSEEWWLTYVAPPAGAWIETVKTCKGEITALVAPPAGAWIETVTSLVILLAYFVAPPAGAWIETLVQPGNEQMYFGSLPPRERGLKHLITYS